MVAASSGHSKERSGAHLNGALVALSAKRNRVLDAYQVGLVDRDELTRRAGTVTSRREQLAKKRGTLNSRSAER